jgi:putative ABC transport system permease protein
LSARGGNLEDYFLKSTTMINNNMFFSYLLLHEGSKPEVLENKFSQFLNEKIGNELKERGEERIFFLSKIDDIHLNLKVEGNVTPSGSLTYLYILGSIAVLTLIIACINFMNLSTSRSSKRSLEVGVRKVLGAEKKSLIWQFLGESLILAFLAFIFAIAFTFTLIPFFEQVSGKDLIISGEQHLILLISFLGLSLLAGLFAGSYPAFYLSSFKPVKVLKGKFSNSLSAVALRKGLVIFQFVISVALIIGSVVIISQMNYLRSADLGFIKDQQVVVPLRSEVAKTKYASLKDKLSNNPNINSVGASVYYPGIFNPVDWLMFKEGNTEQDAKSVYINFIDHNFLQTLGIQTIAGRSFSTQFPSDTNNHLVINKKCAEELGFESTDDAIGKWIGFNWEGAPYKFTIVGVVNDFHFKDLHVNIEPFAFLLRNDNQYNYIISHVKQGNISGTLKSIEETWNELNPDEPFEYSFLDQDFQKNYEAENRLSSIIGYFTFIAILISCLGLFGLANFSFEQRIKEIGIRKVMGASISNLVALLSADFLKLIIISIVIASPLAWFIMNEWLNSFAYKISISWKVFLLTSFLAISIALLTISFQAIKAAMTNPVKNLRTE